MSITKISPSVVDFDDGITISTADNTTQLTLTSTDADASVGPKLDLFRDSGSPADDDILGKIRFLGDNDSNSQLTYADIEARIVDASNGSEDGRLELSTALAGSGSVSRIFMDATETIINNDSKDLDFRVESDANTHAIYLDASTDKLGIGVSSPIARLSLPAQATGDSGIARFAIESAVDDNDFMISQYEDSSGTYTLIGQNLGLNSSGSDTILDGGHRTAAIRLDARGNGSTQFLNGGTNASAETMRISSAGDVIIGDTSVIRASSQTGVSVEPEGRIYLSRGTGTGGFSHLVFYNGNEMVGTVQSSGSATSYNTSSDYRLKENVNYEWEALPRLAQLKPARFNFKVDSDTTIDGFLAHEAQSVVPEAVTGTHNETEDVSNAVLNALGNVIDEGVTEDEWKAGKEAEEGEEPKYAADTVWKAEHTKDVYQGIDQSKLVPLMVKAIQEQQTLIETLEAKVKALEEA